MGQGVHTGSRCWSPRNSTSTGRGVRVEQAGVDQAFANPIFGMQATGGSTSVRATGSRAQAGASARAMLIAAAAETWKADADDCAPSAAW